jgi:hypothetical protein
MSSLQAWIRTLGVAGIVVAAAALVLIVLPQLLPPVGPGPSDSPSPPSASLSPAPSPTAPIVREGWTAIRVIEPIPYAEIRGITEGNGFLLAFGRADRNLVGVWRSVDGQTWEAGHVPQLPSELGGAIIDLTTTNDGFIGLAALGLAEGSEQYASAIYTSPDGLDWTAASHPLDGHWLGSALVAVGSRIVVAGGSGVFVSDDGGQSWQPTTDTEALGGQITDLAADGDRLLGVGHVGSIETAQPLLWESRDGGATWERNSLGDAGLPTHLAVGPGSTIVVLGALGQDAVAWLSDGGKWSTTRVTDCCINGATATPTGYVAVGDPVSLGTAYVARSTDARAWNLEAPEVGYLTGVGWTDAAGLLATTRVDTVLGPTPYP